MRKAHIDIMSEYARNARLKPAFLAILPLAMLAAALRISTSALIGAISGPLSAAGLTYLLAHLSRDLGTRRQAELYREWGGKPSVTKLRHRDGTLNPITRARYHSKAAELLQEPMPTPAEESQNPAAADVRYEAYSNWLLEETRDTKSFPLVFEELISYGFRRNLLGLKPIGLSLAIACGAVGVSRMAWSFRAGAPPDVSNLVFLTIDFLMVLVWTILVGPDWVKRAADSYAERLLAASERLGRIKKSGSNRQSKKDSVESA